MLLHHYTTAQHSRAQHSTAVTVTVTLTRLLTLYNTEYSFKSVTPSRTPSFTCTTRSKQGLQRKHHTNCHENLKCLK